MVNLNLIRDLGSCRRRLSVAAFVLFDIFFVLIITEWNGSVVDPNFLLIVQSGKLVHSATRDTALTDWAGHMCMQSGPVPSLAETPVVVVLRV